MNVASCMEFDEKEPFKPFISHIGEGKADQFMFMGVFRQGGCRIHLYKNKATRNYINIDQKGEFYKWRSDKEQYIPIERDIAWAIANK